MTNTPQNETSLNTLEAQLALRGAELSNDAYLPHSELRLKYSTQQFPFIRSFDNNNDTQGFVAIQKSPSRDIYIVFRGTESIADLNIDFHFELTRLSEYLPPDIKIASGFKSAYESIQSELTSIVQSALNELDGSFDRLLITGHSLGGALSILSAFHFSHTETDTSMPLYDVNFVDKLHLYNFGSPAVGNQSFVDAFSSQLLVSQSRRFVNVHDPIPKSEGALISINQDYRHIDEEIQLSASVETPVTESHSMSTYLLFISAMGSTPINDLTVITSMEIRLQFADVYFGGTSEGIELENRPTPGEPYSAATLGSDFTLGRTYTLDANPTFFEFKVVGDIPSHLYLRLQGGSNADQAALSSVALIINGLELKTLQLGTRWLNGNQSLPINFFQNATPAVNPLEVSASQLTLAQVSPMMQAAFATFEIFNRFREPVPATVSVSGFIMGQISGTPMQPDFPENFKPFILSTHYLVMSPRGNGNNRPLNITIPAHSSVTVYLFAVVSNGLLISSGPRDDRVYPDGILNIQSSPFPSIEIPFSGQIRSVRPIM